MTRTVRTHYRYKRPPRPEEHKQRGAAADALWRELVRRVREGR